MWYLESLKGQLCALCWGHCWLPASLWVLWWDRTLWGSLCRIHCRCGGVEGCLQLPLVQNSFPVALLAAWCWWRSWKWRGGWRQCIGDRCGVLEGERCLWGLCPGLERVLPVALVRVSWGALVAVGAAKHVGFVVVERGWRCVSKNTSLKVSLLTQRAGSTLIAEVY